MLHRASKLFYKIANGRLILLVLVGFIGFLAITLPALQAASGETEGLDTRFFYTPEEAFSTIASYTSQGRLSLRWLYLTVDLVYPVLYTTIFVLMVSWVLSVSIASESSLGRLNILPLGMAIFDLLENISIVTMLSLYPSQPRFAAWLVTIGTMGKYIFMLMSIALLLIGVVKVFLKKVRPLANVELISYSDKL